MQSVGGWRLLVAKRFIGEVVGQARRPNKSLKLTAALQVAAWFVVQRGRRQLSFIVRRKGTAALPGRPSSAVGELQMDNGIVLMPGIVLNKLEGAFADVQGTNFKAWPEKPSGTVRQKREGQRLPTRRGEP